jgi:hypothetical protein
MPSGADGGFRVFDLVERVARDVGEAPGLYAWAIAWDPFSDGITLWTAPAERRRPSTLVEGRFVQWPDGSWTREEELTPLAIPR